VYHDAGWRGIHPRRDSVSTVKAQKDAVALMDSDLITGLIEYASGFPGESMPESVSLKAKELLIDTLGCVYAGNQAQGIKELLDAIRFFGGNPQATVIGFGEKTSAPQAAFINSVMAHARDYDDTHDDALNHGCVTIVPAMIAVCETLAYEDAATKISGREFLAALAIGLDVSNRLGMAFIRHLHTGWLPTTLWGPFGCAAACGRLMGFDKAAMERAFGIAYSQIHGNRQTLIDGALTKRVQPGFSAEAGVKSVFMARAGITGARNIVSGDYGIAALYTNGTVDKSYLTDGLGEVFETMNVSLKPYPSCRCTHPVIDAVKRMRDESGLKADDIGRGEIKLPPKGMGQVGKPFVIRGNPTMDAQFSAQYTAALAMLNDTLSIDDFSAESVSTRKEEVELARRFKPMEAFHNSSGLTPVEVSVELKNGTILCEKVDKPTGSGDNPMTHDQMVFKFRDCLRHAAIDFSDERISVVMDLLMKIHETEDVVKLFNTIVNT